MFRQYTQFFTIFPQEQLNLAGQSDVAIPEIWYLLGYQKVTEEIIMFSDECHLNLSQFFYLEPGLYSSNSNIVEVMNSLIQERHNHKEGCFRVELYRRTQEIEI